MVNRKLGITIPLSASCLVGLPFRFEELQNVTLFLKFSSGQECLRFAKNIQQNG